MSLFKSTLLVGCSLSDYCGFGDNPIGYHDDPRCWYNIVARELGLDLDNHAYGGLSNLEILYRANKQLLNKSYSLIIVQLSSPKRKWFWRDDEPEEFMIFNGGNVCNYRDAEDRRSVEHVGMNLFNTAKEVERDLVNLLMLQKSCQTNNLPMVIIDTMDFMPEADRSCADLFCLLDKKSLLGYPGSWVSSQTDSAEDGIHPGPESNKAYADQVIKHLKKLLSRNHYNDCFKSTQR